MMTGAITSVIGNVVADACMKVGVATNRVASMFKAVVAKMENVPWIRFQTGFRRGGSGGRSSSRGSSSSSGGSLRGVSRSLAVAGAVVAVMVLLLIVASQRRAGNLRRGRQHMDAQGPSFAEGGDAVSLDVLQTISLPELFNVRLLAAEPFWPLYAEHGEATELLLHRALIADGAFIPPARKDKPQGPGHNEQSTNGTSGLRKQHSDVICPGSIFIPVYASLFRRQQMRHGSTVEDADAAAAQFAGDAIATAADELELRQGQQEDSCWRRNHWSGSSHLALEPSLVVVAPWSQHRQQHIHCMILHHLRRDLRRRVVFVLHHTLRLQNAVDPECVAALTLTGANGRVTTAAEAEKAAQGLTLLMAPALHIRPYSPRLTAQLQQSEQQQQEQKQEKQQEQDQDRDQEQQQQQQQKQQHRSTRLLVLQLNAETTEDPQQVKSVTGAEVTSPLVGNWRAQTIATASKRLKEAVAALHPSNHVVFGNGEDPVQWDVSMLRSLFCGCFVGPLDPFLRQQVAADARPTTTTGFVKGSTLVTASGERERGTGALNLDVGISSSLLLGGSVTECAAAAILSGCIPVVDSATAKVLSLRGLAGIAQRILSGGNAIGEGAAAAAVDVEEVVRDLLLHRVVVVDAESSAEERDAVLAHAVVQRLVELAQNDTYVTHLQGQVRQLQPLFDYTAVGDNGAMGRRSPIQLMRCALQVRKQERVSAGLISALPSRPPSLLTMRACRYLVSAGGLVSADVAATPTRQQQQQQQQQEEDEIAGEEEDHLLHVRCGHRHGLGIGGLQLCSYGCSSYTSAGPTPNAATTCCSREAGKGSCMRDEESDFKVRHTRTKAAARTGAEVVAARGAESRENSRLPDGTSGSRVGRAVSLLHAGVARLRMCSSQASHIVAGTFQVGPLVGRILVYEAEVIHGVYAGKYPPYEERGTQRGEVETAFVQLLIVVETEKILRQALNGWGSSYSEYLYKISFKLNCQYWHGADAASQARQHQPAFETWSAYVSDEQFTMLHCPLPVRNRDRGLLTAPVFQLKLVATDDFAILHMPAIVLCRVDMDPDRLPSRSDHPFFSGPPPPSATHAVTGVGRRHIPEYKDNIAVCVRPFFNHHFFATSASRSPGAQWERVREWVDYHVLIGVHKVYMYDRYGQEFMGLFRPYILSGMMEHVPFPLSAEVFYRKEVYSEARDPYLFPDIYDQVINMGHCMMQGRRNNDKWLVFTDVDEYIKYPAMGKGTPLMRFFTAAEAVHTASHARRLRKERRQKKGGESGLLQQNKNQRVLPANIMFHRYHFRTPKNMTGMVLPNVLLRCSNYMAHKWWHRGKAGEPHDKLVVHPWRAIHGVVAIHEVRFLEEEVVHSLPENIGSMHHYGGDLYKCRTLEDREIIQPQVEDRSMVSIATHLEQCWKQMSGLPRWYALPVPQGPSVACNASCSTLCDAHAMGSPKQGASGSVFSLVQ